MPFKIVCLLVRRVLGLAVLVFRTDLAKDAELLVFRHENAVLRRYVGRVRYEPADLWVPRTSSSLHDQAILVDQTTDASLPSDAVLLKIDRFG